MGVSAFLTADIQRHADDSSYTLGMKLVGLSSTPTKSCGQWSITPLSSVKDPSLRLATPRVVLTASPYLIRWCISMCVCVRDFHQCTVISLVVSLYCRIASGLPQKGETSPRRNKLPLQVHVPNSTFAPSPHHRQARDHDYPETSLFFSDRVGALTS